MRLTTELINNSLSYINCLTERELDLRGHKISAIENLGAAKDNDSIDLTDNDIAQLGNFPLNPRLHTLLLAHNRIGAIQPSLSSSIPNVTTLVLTKNKLAELADLDPLAGLQRLTYLTLVENPVTQHEHYRHWVIWRCPTVRFLDFKKIRDVERRQATELFGTTEEPTDLASKIMGTKSRTFDIPSAVTNGSQSRTANTLTAEEKKRFEYLIRNAKSLSEISKLEKYMTEGRMPPGMGDAMDLS